MTQSGHLTKVLGKLLPWGDGALTLTDAAPLRFDPSRREHQTREQRPAGREREQRATMDE